MDFIDAKITDERKQTLKRLFECEFDSPEEQLEYLVKHEAAHRMMMKRLAPEVKTRWWFNRRKDGGFSARVYQDKRIEDPADDLACAIAGFVANMLMKGIPVDDFGSIAYFLVADSKRNCSRQMVLYIAINDFRLAFSALERVHGRDFMEQAWGLENAMRYVAATIIGNMGEYDKMVASARKYFGQRF